eukprot:7331585-Prymnesium_polylepis.1
MRSHEDASLSVSDSTNTKRALRQSLRHAVPVPSETHAPTNPWAHPTHDMIHSWARLTIDINIIPARRELLSRPAAALPYSGWACRLPWCCSRRTPTS